MSPSPLPHFIGRIRSGLPRAIVPVVLGLAATGVTCSFGPPTRPNVVMIVVDTLRPDHLGCYGSVRPTSPSIDSLASVAVRFTTARATSSWTSPSIASILTGLYPSRHGVVEIDSGLSEEVTTLAEILGDEGYQTAAVVSNTLLSEMRGFGQGFDRYETAIRILDPNFLSTRGVTRRSLACIEDLAAQEDPFFLLAHYFDPHNHYVRHPEVGFAPPRAGRLDGTESVDDLVETAEELLPEEFAFLAALYDEEIRHTDAGIGRLLAGLQRAGVDDDTIVILTSDHGEEFGTHGGLTHGRTLYEDVVRVPLIIREVGESRTAEVVDTPVSLVDLAPTILDLVDISPDTLGFQGATFASTLNGEPDAQLRVTFSELGNEFSKTSIIFGRFHLIRDEDSGRVELYDLRRDPDELADRAAEEPEAVERLLPVLEKQIALAGIAAAPRESVAISAEEAELLRSLGYLD